MAAIERDIAALRCDLAIPHAPLDPGPYPAEPGPCRIGFDSLLASIVPPIRSLLDPVVVHAVKA